MPIKPRKNNDGKIAIRQIKIQGKKYKGDIIVGGVQGRYYYFILMFMPLYCGSWFRKLFGIAETVTSENLNFESTLQYLLVYLNILTISIGIYTQL